MTSRKNTPITCTFSQMTPKTAIGPDMEQFSTWKYLSKDASIFTTEISAVNLTLKILSTSNSKKFIFHSDSISVLQSIKNRKLDNSLDVKLLNKLNSISHSKNVTFCWIPSDVGIQGNDKADSLAKATLNMVPNKNSKMPHTKLKHKIK